MSDTAAQLDSVKTAIASLETALADHGIQRYRLPSGHEVQRAHFPQTLATLYARQSELERKLRNETRRRVVRGGMRGRS